MEIQILNAINNLHTSVGDIVFKIITSMGNGGFIWIVLSIYVFYAKKNKKEGIAMILSLILVLIICLGIIKPIVARERPFMENELIDILIKKPTDYSFPSGHTASSFAIITVLYMYKDRLFKPVLILGSLIAFSRMYFYVHYPSDIFAGIIFGIAFGILSSKIVEHFFKTKNIDDD